MKLFLLIAVITAISAGRLENTYLPPAATRFSGGSGGGLLAPILRSPGFSFNQAVGSLPFGRISNTYGSAPAGVTTYSGPATPPVPILRLNNDNDGVGSYRYDYETANHIAVEESGRLKNPESSEVQGSFSYQAPNGQTISLRYIADENGFRPIGDHLPVAPPVPEAILKSLEINAAGKSSGVYRPAAIATSSGYAPSISNQYLPPSGRQGGY